MKKVFILLCALAATCLAPSLVSGQGVIGGPQNGFGPGGYLPKPPFNRPNNCLSGQLKTSLTTGGYEFDVIHLPGTTNLLVDPTNPIVLPLAVTAGKVIPPEPLIRPFGFTATFSLNNGTAAPRAFTFSSQYWADNKIVFTAYDTNDAVGWMSMPIPVDVPPLTTPVTVTLNSGQTWSQSVFVPLNPAGGLLPDGIYRLEATVSGQPLFSANASFDVINLYGGPIKLDPPVPANR